MKQISKSLTFLFVSLLLVGLISGCDDPAAVPPPPASTGAPFPVADAQMRGDRLFTMSVTEAAGEDYDLSMDLARSVGTESVSLSVYWDDIETAPGEFAPDPNWLEIANVYYAAKEVEVTLALSVIDTNNIRLPADLAGRDFDDPEMIDRFNGLLDYVVTQLPDVQLTTLAIGNEIDIYLWNDSAQWAAYETFFVETAAHARTLWPDVPVGTKVTYGGLTSSPASAIQSITKHGDVALVTYYPLNDDFTVRPPSTVHNDFQTISDAFPGQTIYLLETGYPSGSDNNSSEAQQAEFVHEMFMAWDDHAEQIAVLNYTWLTDMPSSAVEDMTSYYRLDDAGFVSYLATLGLRQNDGTEKLALSQLAQEVEARDW
ncbi:MAG: hypothetical protein QNJ45_17830 [Ardenticatenaceae bacterium]|nr:hypothetical protein [Ardenticatenaceae bacterium]